MPELEHPPIPWSEDEVRTFLAEYGYAPRRLAVEQLESWWFNLVLRVEADGERLVLRRYGVTPREEVLWELAVLRHLRAHDFPTISPLMRADGVASGALGMLGAFGGKPAILYPYVEGRNGCHSGLDARHAMGETAALIARLHGLTMGLALPYPRVHAGTEPRRALAEFLRVIHARGVASHETVLARFVDQVEQAAGEFAARLAPYAGDLPSGVVHHDAHCANVLFLDERLVALIDFDDAYEGYIVADLPVMIDNWAGASRRNALQPERAAHIVRTYERHRRLTEAERDLLPDFLALYTLGDTVTFMQEELDGGAPGNEVAAAGRASRRYRRYLSHTQGSASGWRDALRRTLLGE